MSPRLWWALIGIAVCAAAVLMAVLLKSTPQPVAAPKIVVPEGQDSELAVPRPPASSVTVLPQIPPPGTDTGTGTATTTTPAPQSPQQVTPPPARPPASPEPPPRPAGIDLQAENANISNGTIESNHAGFTGSGFVDYRNQIGSSIEWVVTAREATSVDVVFRYANGSNGVRPMAITVNGGQVTTVAFPVTNGWDDWRNLTVRVTLQAGTNRIKAASTTANGGPNVDKITVV